MINFYVLVKSNGMNVFILILFVNGNRIKFMALSVEIAGGQMIFHTVFCCIEILMDWMDEALDFNCPILAIRFWKNMECATEGHDY